MNSLYRKLTVSTMMVLLIAPSWTYANEFFTIIGPDGRPMIVQKQSKKSTQTADHSQAPQQKPSVSTSSSPQSTHPKLVVQPTIETANVPVTVKTVPSQSDDKNTKASSRPEKHQSNTAEKQQHSVVPAVTSSTKADQATVIEKAQSSKSATAVPMIEAEHVPAPPQAVATVSPSQSDTKKAEVRSIDGVEYINNEYLEDREFNLEGKKRFYVMPLYNDVQGGANAKIGHMETVEREKGVNRNFLNKMFNQEQKVDQPLTLATTYYRISKENVEENLEQSCFTGKKVNKAKILGQKNADIGLWPTAPLKDSFDYEIVQVDKNLKDVKLTSYAASQKNPSFYWPLVVFLDQKGCVIEGVGGFKNQDTSSTSLQYASIEGLIRLPEGTAYLFMTPLASAIDVEDKALTNYGQIKLSVLR